jgi:hypothetical protein
MPTLDYTLRPDGLYLHCEQGMMALTPYTPRAIRVRYTLKPEFSTQASLMVVAAPEPGVRFTVEETPATLIFATTRGDHRHRPADRGLHLLSTARAICSPASRRAAARR